MIFLVFAHLSYKWYAIKGGLFNNARQIGKAKTYVYSREGIPQLYSDFHHHAEVVAVSCSAILSLVRFMVGLAPFKNH